MRFRWGHLSILGVIVAIVGILAIIIRCPLLALFPPFVVGEPCDPSGIAGMVGLIMAFSGATLVVFTEVARRLYHPPNAPI